MSEQDNTQTDMDAAIQKMREKQERDRKRVMDPNDEFYLAGFLTFGPDDFEEFTPKALRGLPNAPVYHLRPFTRAQVKAINASMGDPEKYDQTVMAAIKESGIIGWKRVDRKGNPLPFTPEAIENMSDTELNVIFGRCYAYATGILPEEAEGFV